MRLSKPRITPLPEANEAQAAVLAPFVARGADHNIFRTMARHPGALDRFLKWGNYILGKHNTLPPRERELAIMRTGYNCGSGYEWAQHAVIGKQAGLTGKAAVVVGAGLVAAAETASFLARDAAGFVTDALLPVDGGQSVRLG